MLFSVTFKRGSTNSGRSNGLQSLETDDPIQNTNQSTKGSGESSSVPTKDTSSRVRKSKHRASKAKPFKIINPGRPGSADSADLDPEEEKLKLLPDCCEYTARHGHAFEDEGRKQMCSAWFKEVKISKPLTFKLVLSLVSHPHHRKAKILINLQNLHNSSNYRSPKVFLWWRKPELLSENIIALFPSPNGMTNNAFVFILEALASFRLVSKRELQLLGLNF